MTNCELEIFTDIHKQYFDRLVWWCRNYVNGDPDLKDNAEDWVQEAFYRALKDPVKFIAHEKKYAWLVLTCKHIIDNDFQKRHVRRKHTQFNIDGPNALPIEDVTTKIEVFIEAEHSTDVIKKVISMLTKSEKDIFYDVFIDNMPTKATAKKQNKSQGAVKSALRRIRAKAKKVSDSDYFRNYIIF